jgi:hypothetical protein
MSARQLNPSSIHSPWLRPREAAQYCRLSLSLFNQKRKEVPIKFGGTQRRPRFHRDELDHWMQNGFKKKVELGKGPGLPGKPLTPLKNNVYRPHFLH